METVGILEQIQSLVSDKLQVVSYKWLSRNFLVSSNDAKRLLQEFVDNYGAGLEVVYTVSGWLKNNPSTYHIRLVSQPKLSEAKEDFAGECSVQVYCVQACLPKDPAVLWNAEYIQAEELFKQPVGVDNCLRDNRFCGVSNAFVKRNAGGSNTTPVVKSSGVVEQSKNTPMQHNPALPPVQQKVVQQSSTNTSLLHTLSVDKNSKSEYQLKEKQEPSARPSVKTEGVHQLPINQRKLQNDKNSTGSAGALANMWGRASAKPKVECASAKSNNILPNSADAQISAHEETDHRNSNDDDDDDVIGEGVSNKPGGNGDVKRKRRVVFDYSDEEDELDAVNLSSPDPPKKQLVQGSTHSSNFSDLEKINLKFEDENVNEPIDKAVRKAEAKKKQILKEEKECLALSKSNDTKISTLEKKVNNNSVVDKNVIEKVTEIAPKSPKRRKVLKTRIDERGREVTEVIWEGEEPEAKPDSNTMKKVDSNVGNTAANRPSGVKKSPALGANAPVNQTGKAANKKAGNKDPKQGNILSFFKKKV